MRDLFQDCMANADQDYEKRTVALSLLRSFLSQLDPKDGTQGVCALLKSSILLNPLESKYQTARVEAVDLMLSDSFSQSFPAVESELIMVCWHMIILSSCIWKTSGTIKTPWYEPLSSETSGSEYSGSLTGSGSW